MEIDKGRTLKERLDHIGEANIKVGAVDGSSFFYCGSTTDLLDHMDIYSNIITRRLDERLRAAFTDEDREWHEEYISKAPALADRVVADVFMADKRVDKGVVVIMVEGNEGGSFWMHNEARDDRFRVTGFKRGKIEFTEVTK